MSESHFDRLAEMEPIAIWDGVVARAVEGRALSFAVIELDPDSVVPEHRHVNEQLGLVITGSVTFRVADEVRELGPGGTWSIPPNVPHEVHTGPDGAVVLDVFAPPRADWVDLARTGRRPTVWP